MDEERAAVTAKNEIGRGTAASEEAFRSSLIAVAASAAAVAVLLLAARHSYLLFHALAEVFAIIAACGVFMVAWNSRRFLGSGYFLVIGAGYLSVAVLDMLHMFAYKGMGILEAVNDIPTQLWIAARYVESSALVIAPAFLSRRIRSELVMLACASVTALLLFLVFSGIFPTCFVEGSGLTRFKIGSEYLISVVLAVTLAQMWKQRSKFDQGIFRMMAMSIILTIASEMSFTLYNDPYDFANKIGHLLKIASFVLIYKALIETGLTRPYALLFRDLAVSEERFKNLNSSLEQRVSKRTSQLRALAVELTHAEQRERKRIAAVLHDNLQQLLAAAKLGVQLGARRCHDEKLLDELNRATGIIDEAIQASRSLAMELSPPVLHETGLVAAMKWRAQWMNEKHGLTVEVQAETEILADPQEACALIFQSVRELLFNVVKHSETNSAVISVRQPAPNLVEVSVADSGKGFDTNDIESGGGFGLHSIRERLTFLGGRMDIESTPQLGTLVTLVAPLSHKHTAPSSNENDSLRAHG
jgi:signal transduction histidine kinase